MTGPLLLAAVLMGQGPSSPSSPPPNALRQKASYSLGLTLGRTLREQAIEIDPDHFARGLEDGVNGRPGRLDDERLAEVLLRFGQDVLVEQKQRIRMDEARRRALDDALLKANASRPGVTTRPSGLQYRIVREGTGPAPGPGDTVRVRCRGTLSSGAEIDRVDAGGPPRLVPVARAIPGWAEALPLMKVGATWELVIPPHLGFGAKPRPGSPIPANAVLIYELELLGIERKN